MALANAVVVHFSVSAKRNTAVLTPASTGYQLGPGRRSKYCGWASMGLVTIVSRVPVTTPGR